MLKKLLNTSYLLLSFSCIQAQNNCFEINTGLSYRFANNAVFGYETSEGRHSDLPSSVYGINYGRKIRSGENNSTFAILGYRSIGIIGKKLYFPEKPDPNWGGTINDAYHQKYELRLQNFELGLSQTFNLTEKVHFTTSIKGNYLFRINDKIITEYTYNSNLRNFRKIKSVSSLPPDSTFNRITLSASVGFEYQILKPTSFFVAELGSYVTDLKNERNNVFPIWLDLGYKFKF